MDWQDIVLTIGSALFSVALLPSVFGKNKPAWSSSLLTGSVLGVFAVVYATLGLWFSFGSTLVTASLWFVLLAQAIQEAPHA